MPKEWKDLATIYARMGAPMRPSPIDVDRVNGLIAGADQNVLLLGATPEYADLGVKLTAVDGTAEMIRDNWPGDNDRRRALLGDWVNLPFPEHSFTAIIGDGSLGSGAGGLPRLFPELRRVLAPGGVAAIRTFCNLETPETLDGIVAATGTAPDANALCLRLRMAMAMTAETPDYVLPIRDVAFAFDRLFPDRAALAAHTDWTADEIDRIDSMKTAEYSVGFPPRSYIRNIAEHHFSVAFAENEGYPLADRCPVVVLR